MNNKKKLSVAIVGAGMGGLAVAATLRLIYTLPPGSVRTPATPADSTTPP